MKRGAERDLRETYAKRQKQRESDAHWVADDAAVVGDDECPLIVVEGADVPISFSGRQSFGQFNVALERRNEALAAGIDPDAAPVEASAAAAPAPSLHSNAVAFSEPVLATPRDDPAPRAGGTEARATLRGARVTGPRPLISKKHTRRNGKNGSVDDSALRKRRNKKR